MYKMNGKQSVWIIIVYIVGVCPLEGIFSHGFVKSTGGVDTSYGEAHIHPKKPCDSCPRQGSCVPRISCPAHLRPNSFNPECHLKDTGQVGVCCYTGAAHAAESEKSSRQRSAIQAEDAKSAHNFSHAMVEKMFLQAENVLKHWKNTIVKEDMPDFGLHLSLSLSDLEVKKLGRGGLLNLLAAQELRNRQALTDEELMLDFTQHTDGPFCPPLPICSDPLSRYRSISGECNNAVYPTWGAANTGFERLLHPDYGDRIWSLRTSVTGLPLPSARAVSVTMLPDASFPSHTHNMMFMQMSQFIAHDMSAAVVYSTGNNSGISCCTREGQFLPPEHLHFACAAVTVDPTDEFYSQFGRTCLNFVRAELAPSPDCSAGYAKPMNGATHFLDLSQLYGKTADKMEQMSSGGLLKTFTDYGRELPPLTDRKECMSASEHGACFESGDTHGNQVISLTALHTIFTREHNRIAHALSRLNPLWDKQTVFYEARRILQGMFQHIVYGEWLPLILGPHIMKTFDLYPSHGYSTSYNSHTNPALVTEFSAAAMRFGHSTVDGKLTITYPKSGALYEAISLPEVMFDPSRVRIRPFLDRMLHGLVFQPMQSVDPFVTEALTRYMFHGGHPHGLDLASLNIQRGRDYGVRSYNHYRRLIGLEPYTDFYQFPPSASKRLSSVYSSPEDVDLWIGGLLEAPVEGGLVGPTFAHIIAEQFSRLKRGDRYYYEHGPDVNPGAFTPGQLAEIKKITLARIICDNLDGIELTSMPPQAFLQADLPENTPVPCDSTIIPSVDLTRFRVI